MDISRFHNSQSVPPIARPPNGIKCVQIIRHNVYSLCTYKVSCNSLRIKSGRCVTGFVLINSAILRAIGGV